MTLVFSPDHQSTSDKWSPLMAQNQEQGTEQGQAPRGGNMGILTEPPLRITLVGSGCAIPLQSMTIGRAAGDRDMVPGV
jgi:hypothetical protein